MRFHLPRARGAGSARAPQIGPGTLEGRTMNAQLGRPSDFSLIAYSPGNLDPDIEYWCFRQPGAGGPTAVDFQTLDNNQSLWLDLVPDFEKFAPPVNPIGDELVTALKAYAVQRYQVNHGAPTSLSEWQVRTYYPGAFAPSATAEHKLARGVYQVRQEEFPTGDNRTAWVWVPELGRQEFWLLYRPGESGGFCRVGQVSPFTGQVHTSSKLTFERINDSGQPDRITYGPTGSRTTADLDVNNPGPAIQHLMEMTRWASGSPAVLDPESDLRIDDFRVSDVL